MVRSLTTVTHRLRPTVASQPASGASPASCEIGFCPRSTAAYPALVNSTAYLGGPVGPYWSVLSPRPTAHSYSPTAGVHVVASLTEAHQQVVDGALGADDVRFFSGYAAWPISRLEEEVASGKWKVAKASEALLLSGLRGGDLAARLAVAMQ